MLLGDLAISEWELLVGTFQRVEGYQEPLEQRLQIIRKHYEDQATLLNGIKDESKSWRQDLDDLIRD